MLYSATPIKYGYGIGSRFEGWNDYTAGTTIHADKNWGQVDNPNVMPVAFLFKNPHPNVPVNKIQISFYTSGLSNGDTVSISAHNNNVPSGELFDAVTYTHSASAPSGNAILTARSPVICEYITIDFFQNFTNRNFDVSARSLGIQPPDVVVSVSPKSVYTDEPITINFENRLGDTLFVEIGRNYTVLDSFETNQDSATYTCPASWLDGYSGSSVSLFVRADRKNDAFDTRGTKYFTLKKRTPNVVTIIGPESKTFDGGEQINFAWSSTGDGTQTSAELDWSLDEVEWTNFATISGSAEIFKSSPATFPPNKIYWRVRVLNSLGVWSAYGSANFTIRYSATSYVVPLNSPTGGNVDASRDIPFAGTLLSNGVPYETFTMAAATFYWRSRTADPYTEVSMTPDGANASVVIPGGTFPSGTVYWYIAATDNAGTSTQTDVYSISTLSSKIDASPVAPVGVIETKNTPTAFSWRYATVTGSEQKAAQLQYSTDGGDTWLELGSVQGAETSYTAPANALPSGTITWRVRAENAADEWGEWSNPVSFVNFGAPDVTSVLTDGKPYTTITWQVNDQESYKLIVDGVQIGPYHGEDVRSYTLSQPLADGQHTVQVQVQNEYSQWSPINGTVFDVVNTPGTAITLSHNTDVDVELTWTAGDGTGNYYVYRDGVPIAHTGEMAFVDRVALGTHEYYVIERLASGDYTHSNTVTATPGVGCSPMIAPLAGGEWLPLALSLDSDRVIQISDEVRTSERFVLGADFPVVTIGRHRTRRVSLDAAWLRNSIRNDEFMALLGKAVILKLPWGDVFVGVLPAYAQSNARFTSGYAYSISQADWRDYIDNA